MKICFGAVISVVVVAMAVFAVMIVREVVFSTPSDDVVRREFLDRYPNAAIKNFELIFEQGGQTVYLITAREQGGSDEGKYDFAIEWSDGAWKWCDDRTERQCGPFAR